MMVFCNANVCAEFVWGNLFYMFCLDGVRVGFPVLAAFDPPLEVGAMFIWMITKGDRLFYVDTRLRGITEQWVA